MKVKLSMSLSGDRFYFAPRDVIACPAKVGLRLIDQGVGEEAPESVEAVGSFDDTPPEEEAVGENYRGQKWSEWKAAHRNPEKGMPETATMKAPEKAVTHGPVDHCQGETKQGNPCLRAPLAGSQFCAAHQPKEA